MGAARVWVCVNVEQRNVGKSSVFRASLDTVRDMARIALSVVVAAVLAVCGAAWFANAASSRPELEELKGPVVAQQAVRFTVTGVGAGRNVFLEVSTSRKRRQGRLPGGTLPAPNGKPALRSFVRAMAFRNGRYEFTLRESDVSYLGAGQFWASTPGRYWWSAFVAECSTKRRCLQPSRAVRQVVVTAAK